MINSFEEWTDVYKKLISWEIKLENTNESSMNGNTRKSKG